MQTTVNTVSAYMDAWAPPGLAYEWDKVGLQTGSADTPVRKILVCLSVSPEALATARRLEANMIIAHHPLIWEPLKTLCTDQPHTRLCLELAQSNIACFVAHTNLDIAEGGVNTALAERLGLSDVRPLFPRNKARQVKLITFVPDSHLDKVREALAAAGAGIIGDYTHCSFNTPGVGTFIPGKNSTPYTGNKGRLHREPEWRIEMVLTTPLIDTVIHALYQAHPYEEPAYDVIALENRDAPTGLGARGILDKAMPLDLFSRHVRDALGLSYVLTYGMRKRTVRHVAVLGGSGGSYMDAIPADTDVYVTGDVRYHEAQQALARGIPCIDASHAGTELPVVDKIVHVLRAQFPNLAIRPFREKALAHLSIAPPAP